MPTPAHDLGDLRRLSATFKDTAGAVTDPGTTTFVMREPDGVATTYVFPTNAELVKDSTGKFHVDWTIAKAGRHAWRFTGTVSGVVQSEGDEFYARRQEARTA